MCTYNYILLVLLRDNAGYGLRRLTPLFNLLLVRNPPSPHHHDNHSHSQTSRDHGEGDSQSDDGGVRVAGVIVVVRLRRVCNRTSLNDNSETFLVNTMSTTFLSDVKGYAAKLTTHVSRKMIVWNRYFRFGTPQQGHNEGGKLKRRTYQSGTFKIKHPFQIL